MMSSAGTWAFLVSVCIDEILIFSKNAEEYQHHLDLVQELLQQHQFIGCIEKRTFLQLRVLLCGYTIHTDGLRMESQKIKVIFGWPAQTTDHEV